MDEELPLLKEPPKFESKVPSNLRKLLSEEQLWLADMVSINDQRSEWLTQYVITAYNLAIRNHEQITIWKNKFFGPLGWVLGAVGVIATAAIGEFIKVVWKKVWHP